MVSNFALGHSIHLCACALSLAARESVAAAGVVVPFLYRFLSFVCLTTFSRNDCTLAVENVEFGNTFGDTWVYIPDRKEWTDLSGVAVGLGNTLSRQTNFGMASADGLVFLFGGSEGDTWYFDPSRASWTKSPRRPPTRFDCRLVAADGGDGRSRIYLFGGAEFDDDEDEQGEPLKFNDVWSLDPPTKVWTEIPINGTWPTGRIGHGWNLNPQPSIMNHKPKSETPTPNLKPQTLNPQP